MGYTEELVETFLPSVWDRTYAWGVQNPNTPAPDMPKAKYKNPKDATTFWAHIIDVRIAWARAPLTMFQRRALLLHYGCGWSQEQIALSQSVSQSAVNKRLARGVDTMTDWLNASWDESGEEELSE